MIPGDAPPGGGPGPIARLLRREAQLLLETLRGWRDGAAGRWARRPSAPRLAALAFAAGAVALATLSVLAQAGLPTRLPSRRDWIALRTVVERDARPGDAVVLSPPWAERAREVLPASVPVLAGARFDGEELVGVRRIWLVSLPDAPGSSFGPEGDLRQRAARGEPPVRIGALELTRFDLAFPVLPLAFLPDHLARAEVSSGGVPCAADAGEFRCTGPSRARVTRAVREVAGAPRPCFVATLEGATAAPLVIALPRVRIGRLLRGHAGAVGAPTLGTPLRIAAVVDGEEVGTAEVSGPGFVPFQIDTTRFAGRPLPLALSLTTAGAGGVLCFDAVTMP